GGLQFRVRVPDEVDLKVELEIEDDATELEIELSWQSTAPVSGRDSE
ncbi:MAG: Amphi-Trp domain, partial [Solirubrobacteraceae bacterium]|nr:Amphi-Trp domain [Solirubrobacteraceae bacterium]